MNAIRKEALAKLFDFDNEFEQMKKELGQYDWDCDEELITITPLMVKTILMKVISDKIPFDRLEDWANFIECRDDIGFDGDSSTLIKEIITSLANPYLYGEISVEKIERWLEQLDDTIHV